MILEEEHLAHFGIIRRSGRYPWGSGGNIPEEQRNREFLDYVGQLRRDGMSETDIAKGMGITRNELQAYKSIARNEQKAAKINEAYSLKEKGYSNVAIGKKMGIPESSVRSLLAPGQKDKVDKLTSISSMLKEQVDEHEYIDIGKGVENQLGITKDKLATAVTLLKEDGYTELKVQVDQLGTGQKTLVKVLAPPGTTYRDVVLNKDKIRMINETSDDYGLNFLGMVPPKNVDSSRVAINYAEDGGSDADGVMYIRPGVDDLSMGGKNYAQVRVAVDGSHFIKGMAIYKEGLPEGVDVVFNTNKSDTGNKLDALKSLKSEDDNPFGAIVDQIKARDADGNEYATSALNLVNVAGDWDEWNRTLSSQMLSKQKPTLAKTQLDVTYENKKAQLDTIKAMTNPTVRRKLLEDFADATDSSSVHLKAAAMPRQQTQVLIPVNSMKDTEIYAPNFLPGERVVLIRYPHGGTFEIPELTVNNSHPAAKKLLGNAEDAVGINSKVAQRLSGADFDGDTVLVIPNNSGSIKTKPALEGLKGFDPQAAYPSYEGMPPMKPKTKQIQMGLVSNLITDMTIRGASDSELARAVRHSMVVIDAEKHHLNYKLSAEKNGIKQLKKKYQGESGGASTLISLKKKTITVPERKLSYRIDKTTGKRVPIETGNSYVDKKTGKTVTLTSKVNKLAELDDAHKMSSGTRVEAVYAEHSNRLKSLANEARREAVNTPPLQRSSSAARAYSNEVASLNAKLNVALKNAPVERRAQLQANATVSTKRDASPDMERAEVKKIEYQALSESRRRLGAQKQRITIEPNEWEAIQAGAISNHKLTEVLRNADMDQVRKLATPTSQLLMTSAKTNRANAMASSGYTQAEIAAALGVSLTTLKEGLK